MNFKTVCFEETPCKCYVAPTCVFCVCVCRRGGCGWSIWTHSERWPTRCCSAGRSWRLEKSRSSRSDFVSCGFFGGFFSHIRFLCMWTDKSLEKKFNSTHLVPLCVQEGPAFRYTTSEVTVQPSPCLSYRIPRDFVDLSAGEDAYKLIDFLKLVGCCCISLS